LTLAYYLLKYCKKFILESYELVATHLRSAYLLMHLIVSILLKTMTPLATDKELLEQVKASDTEAFRQIFERYQPVLFRQVNFQMGHTDQSHDIVQQTFISVWEHRKSLQPHLSFLAYILRISRNLMYDIHKHQKIRERTHGALPPQAKSELDDPVEALHASILREKISTVINELPHKCREIFLLSRFEGKSNREIAESMKISVRTVEHQISHALKIVRNRLSKSAERK
jgi:RNA polymerase sigma-70 factor, ECF subfamily